MNELVQNIGEIAEKMKDPAQQAVKLKIRGLPLTC